VGALELEGVTKLLFGQCELTSTEATGVISAGNSLYVYCTINGVDSDDSAIAALSQQNSCFETRKVVAQSNTVSVQMVNECSTSQAIGTSSIAIIVFDE
jgi:hypothetical protein